MQRRLIDAILKGFAVAKPHLMVDDLPPDIPVQLLCSFRLGDLRTLDQIRAGERLISGATDRDGEDAGTPRPTTKGSQPGATSVADEIGEA